MKPTSRKIVQFFVAAMMSVTLANSAVAEQNLSRSVDGLVWVNGGPGLDFALLWGDWTKDDYGMIVRIRAGHAARGTAIPWTITA